MHVDHRGVNVSLTHVRLYSCSGHGLDRESPERVPQIVEHNRNLPLALVAQAGGFKCFVEAVTELVIVEVFTDVGAEHEIVFCL